MCSYCTHYRYLALQQWICRLLCHQSLPQGPTANWECVHLSKVILELVWKSKVHLCSIVSPRQRKNEPLAKSLSCNKSDSFALTMDIPYIYQWKTIMIFCLYRLVFDWFFYSPIYIVKAYINWAMALCPTSELVIVRCC